MKLLAAAVLLSACGALAQTATAPSAPASRSEQSVLAQGAAIFDPAVPAALEVKRLASGHLVVRPRIDGQPAGAFLLDTGAGVCVISTPKAQALALQPAGSVEASGVGGARRSEVLRAREVRLGPVTLHDHPLLAADLTFLEPLLHEDIAGVIGFGLLSRCVVELDLKEARVALHDPASYEIEGASWQPLQLVGRIPCVAARFEGHEGLFRLDTGADGHVTIHEPTVRRLGLLDGRELTDTRLGGVGGFVAAKSGLLTWFEIGGVRRDSVPATFAVEAKGNFADRQKDGNIGVRLLEPFVLVLDYPHERIAFRPRGKSG